MAYGYRSIVNLANSASLRARVEACAADEGINNPEGWVSEHRWHFATQPGLADDWEYAANIAATNPNVNPDLGARTDVIDDAKILAAVAAIRAEYGPPVA